MCVPHCVNVYSIYSLLYDMLVTKVLVSVLFVI